MKKTIKKAQMGTSIKSVNTELDSLVKAKKSSGAKEWSAKEQADYKKQKSKIGAPPAGFKPKTSTKKMK